MLSNIPAELRAFNQWVVSSANKNPLNPRTGSAASVGDPSTWGTFEEAIHAGYQNVGFVLTKEDPYCIIDLDAPITEEQALRHRAIVANLYTYQELSQSGTGIHIVCRGSIPSGVRRDKVEIYSDGRYMIFTGKVINQAPIMDHAQALLNMHSQMASTVVAELEELSPSFGDEELYETGQSAANGDKFAALFSGDIGNYPSQSEADFALLSMLAFYSKSNEQVRRVFRMSRLGQRDKATRNDDYLNRALSKIRARQQAVPHVDLSALLANINAPVAQQLELLPPSPPPEFLPPPPAPETQSEALPPPPPAHDVLFPPGMVGDMAAYFYSSAVRPVREMALCAALALTAGLLGRQFNISHTGLNLYLVLLAKTGTGKESMANGINALLHQLNPQVPNVMEFLGPAQFASGQALTRLLDKKPSFVSIQGEMGLTLQQVCAHDATAPNIQLRKVLLDVFGKSGWNQTLQASVYSDSEKNTSAVRAPNVTILGESTPESFYQALDTSHIAEGLVPRFLVVEYTGDRVPLNPNAFHAPDANLLRQLQQAMQATLTMKANDTCCPITQDSQGKRLLSDFNELADAKINQGDNDLLRQLWNRAHLKALKLAGLVAVGVNPNGPMVTAEIARWAIDFVTKEIEGMLSKFSSGEVGTGDHKSANELLKCLEKWETLTQAQRQGYQVPSVFFDKPHVIPYSFIRRYLGSRASFRNHKLGAVKAIDASLDDALKTGTIGKLSFEQAKTEFNVSSGVFYLEKAK